MFEALFAASRDGLLPRRYPLGVGFRPRVPGEAPSDVDVFRPGLMTGLAGLGHALLKAHDASTTCVLTLEAPHPGPVAPSEAARAGDAAAR